VGAVPHAGLLPAVRCGGVRATTLPDIIQEMLLATRSEREGRVIDYDQSGSMEEKKREGYF
jgi:sulfate adenylyltransferase subunit 2